MGNSQFRFNQFVIEQDRCAMKVGTDGVLLGAWAAIEGAERILDIGTGTGLIALMCAQRNRSAQIHAIEIDPSSASQAIENINSSPFAHLIEVEQIALQEYRPSWSFDAIICNPPFFDAGTPSPDPQRHQARHADSLTMKELLVHCKRLIDIGGRLHLILPLDREKEFENASREESWYIERLTIVHPNAQRPPKRMLVTCASQAVDSIRSELTIEKETRHDYTSEYIELTSAFYPKMN